MDVFFKKHYYLETWNALFQKHDQTYRTLEGMHSSRNITKPIEDWKECTLPETLPNLLERNTLPETLLNLNAV